MIHQLHLIRIAAFAIFLGAVSQAQAEPDLDFTLVNKTGFDIKAVYVSPTSKEDWEENMIQDVLENGDSLDISFNPGQNTTEWDVMVVWTDDDAAYWRNCDLSEISKLTLFYDVDTSVASATVE